MTMTMTMTMMMLNVNVSCLFGIFFIRVHRLGQTKDVTVYRFICADTVEEKLLALQVCVHSFEDIRMSNMSMILLDMT